MDLVVPWLLLPVVLWATSLGWGGLLPLRGLERELVMPLGFALCVVVLAVPYSLGLGAAWAAGALVLGAGLGLVRGGLRARLPPPPLALAALAAYGLYLAPVALSGSATFTGYGLLGDTSVHFAMVDHVSEHGTTRVPRPPSTFAQTTAGLLGSGYPLGLHFELASLRWLLRTEVAWLYQPFMAAIMAVAALPAAALARSAGMRPFAAAATALLVVGAGLPYAYALQGGVKEVGMVLFLLLGAALAPGLLDPGRAMPTAARLGVVTAAAFGVYSTGGLPWFGLMVAAVLIAVLAGRPGGVRRAVLLGGAYAGVLLVGALPRLAASLSFFQAGAELVESEARSGVDLGNLIGPLPAVQAFGIWLGYDYRVGPAFARVNYALIAVAALAVALGLWHCLRRRRLGPPLLLAAGTVVWLALDAGPYIEAKLLALVSPALVLMAALGAWALWASARRAAALVLALVLAGGVLASDALAYRGLYLAPKDRLEELAMIGERFRGRGPALLNEFEEYGKHFLRDVPALVPYDGWTHRSQALRDPEPIYAGYRDLDAFDLGFVQRFPLLVRRRSPVASRPPAGYRRAYAGRFYEVWRRSGPVLVSDHGGLGNELDPTARPSCAEARRLAGMAAETDEPVRVAVRPRPITVLARLMARPPHWPLTREGEVTPNGPGRMDATFRAGAGRYRVWVRGTFARGATVKVDELALGRASGSQPPGQFARVGAVTLSAGEHRLALVRGGGSLAPGNARGEAYDVVVLEPVAEPRIEALGPEAARGLCRRRADWVAVVSARPLPHGRPPCLDLRAPPADERVLLRPTAGTWYARDALNPDVVRRGKRFYLFFSGNRARTDAGEWRTGFATARSPLGPFRVDPRAAAPFLNGGTIVSGGDFLQGYDRRAYRRPQFARSGDGRRWRPFASLPAGAEGSWNFYPSDPALELALGGFRTFFSGRPSASGADLGAARYRERRWSRPRRVLLRVPGMWDGRDLGEPATFSLGGRRYMLYNGLRADGRPRAIGLAVLTRRGWRRCGRREQIEPGGSWYRRNAVDPEALVAGDRLYVFFGGGNRPSLGANMGGTIGVRAYRLADVG